MLKKAQRPGNAATPKTGTAAGFQMSANWRDEPIKAGGEPDPYQTQPAHILEGAG
jgi:hypothetical protein